LGIFDGMLEKIFGHFSANISFLKVTMIGNFSITSRLNFPQADKSSCSTVTTHYQI